MPWILISLVVGVAVAVAVSVAAVRARRGSPLSELTSSHWITLGLVFLGTGVATMPTLGVAMIGVAAAGVVYLIIGIRARDANSR